MDTEQTTQRSIVEFIERGECWQIRYNGTIKEAKETVKNMRPGAKIEKGYSFEAEQPGAQGDWYIRRI